MAHALSRLSAILLVLVVPICLDVKAAPAPTWSMISWRTCSGSDVDEKWIAYWKKRLECGVMLAPIADDQGSGKGLIGVELVRINAGKRPDRQGAIFFNFGGPGRDPRRVLPDLAYLWSLDDGTAVDTWLRTLSERFDLVAVVPRGLSPSQCGSMPPTNASFPDVDETGWANVVDAGKAVAHACNKNEIDDYMGTLQHVQDMERARLSLGEPSLNFLGYSYGAWTGAFYAATYPEHAGRMVLDSPGNFTGSFEDQLDDQSHDFQTLFTQRALLPAVADPDYGIDADTALQRLREMPYQVRKAWAWAIGTPAELVAALAMSDWFRAEPHVDLNHWVRRIVQHRFHAKEEVNDTIRDAALGLAYITRESTELAAGINPYVYYGLVCGDTPWRKHLDSLRSMAMSHAVLYPAAASDHINTGAVCHHWRSSARWRPPLTELAKAPPLLIIQAEFDPVASLRSTNNAFVASPGAFMIVAEGMYGHGVFGMSHTYCVERGVGVYFLRGEVPYARFSKCEFRAQTPSRIHGASQPGISEVRARLKEILRRS